MENVAGILLPQYATVLRRFLKKVDDGGFDCINPIKRLNAAEFGVPQRRMRAFIMGWRRDQVAPCYPSPTLTRITVADAIADLTEVEHVDLDGDCYVGGLGEPSGYSRGLRKRVSGRGVALLHDAHCITGFSRTAHSDKTVRRFAKVAPGGVDSVSRYIRLSRNGVAPTLRAGTGFDNGRFMAPRPIHYEFDRCICLREAARLHSYPDWFVFDETKWHGFMQIGNSVPPALARAVGNQIRRAITTSDSRRTERSSRARA
jgi:DNA (cytosine-5)-methyltransferase 1